MFRGDLRERERNFFSLLWYLFAVCYRSFDDLCVCEEGNYHKSETKNNTI